LGGACRRTHHDPHQLLTADRSFMPWNLPYRAFRSSSAVADHFSPFPDTPAYLHIPNTTLSLSPTNTLSAYDAPTPTTLAIKNNPTRVPRLQSSQCRLAEYMDGPPSQEQFPQISVRSRDVPPGTFLCVMDGLQGQHLS